MASVSKNTQKTDPIIYIINYLLWWFTGLIIYVTLGQKDSRLKRHALQAIVLGIIGTVLFYIWIVGPLISFIIWIYGMYIGYEAYNGRDLKIPVLSDYIK